MGRARQTEALRRLARRVGDTFVLGEVTFRMRRGQLVRIPDEWLGKVTRPQTIRKRKNREDGWGGYTRGRLDRECQDKLTEIYGEEPLYGWRPRRRFGRLMAPAPTSEMNKAEVREQLRDMDDA